MNEPSPEEMVSATVHGRVQGVGFRWATRERAKSLELRGWVRNDPEGTVSLQAAGHPIALDALHEFLRQGPPGADVVRVDWKPGFSIDAAMNFVIRR